MQSGVFLHAVAVNRLAALFLTQQTQLQKPPLQTGYSH
jgi:hypothetical protein